MGATSLLPLLFVISRSVIREITPVPSLTQTIRDSKMGVLREGEKVQDGKENRVRCKRNPQAEVRMSQPLDPADSISTG